MKTGKIVEARKDGVNYIHVLEDNLNLDDQQHGPHYKTGWLIAKLTDVLIANPRVGQAVQFDVHKHQSGSKSAINVSVAGEAIRA